MYIIVNKRNIPFNAYSSFWDTKGVFRKDTYTVYETEEKAIEKLLYIKKDIERFFKKHPEQKLSRDYNKMSMYWNNVINNSKFIKLNN